MMEAIGPLLEHSDVGVLTLIGAYIVYETRLGVIADVRRGNRILAVGLYRVLERDSDLDEEEFRTRFWGEENGGMMPGDLDVSDPPNGEV